MMTLVAIAQKAINEKLAIQHPDELSALLARVRDIDPRTVLEIGSAQGGTWWALSQVAHPEALMVSVDMPSDHHLSPEWAETIGMKPRFDRVSSKPDVLRHRLVNAVQPGQAAVVIQGDSKNKQIKQAVRDAFQDRSVDVAFIDGGHDYPTVRSDFYSYGPLVRDGGIVAFHDVASTEHNLGVPKLWKEIIGAVPAACREYVALGSPCGIGVVTMGAAVAELLKGTGS